MKVSKLLYETMLTSTVKMLLRSVNSLSLLTQSTHSVYSLSLLTRSTHSVYSLGLLTHRLFLIRFTCFIFFSFFVLVNTILLDRIHFLIIIFTFKPLTTLSDLFIKRNTQGTIYTSSDSSPFSLTSVEQYIRGRCLKKEDTCTCISRSP